MLGQQNRYRTPKRRAHNPVYARGPAPSGDPAGLFILSGPVAARRISRRLITKTAQPLLRGHTISNISFVISSTLKP